MRVGRISTATSAWPVSTARTASLSRACRSTSWPRRSTRRTSSSPSPSSASSVRLAVDDDRRSIGSEFQLASASSGRTWFAAQSLSRPRAEDSVRGEDLQAGIVDGDEDDDVPAGPESQSPRGRQERSRTDGDRRRSVVGIGGEASEIAAASPSLQESGALDLEVRPRSGTSNGRPPWRRKIGSSWAPTSRRMRSPSFLRPAVRALVRHGTIPVS